MAETDLAAAIKAALAAVEIPGGGDLAGYGGLSDIIVTPSAVAFAIAVAPGMEAALVGHAEGSRATLHLTPAEAYGDRNPELLQNVSRRMLAEHAGADATFEPGDLVEFTAPNGGRYSGVLKSWEGDAALFDFNHPLAGTALRVDVAILGVL